MTVFASNLMLVRATGFWRRAAPQRGRVLSVAQDCFFFANLSCNALFILSKLMHTMLNTDSLRNITENISDVLCIAFSLLQLLVLQVTEAHLIRTLDRIDEGYSRMFQSVAESRELLLKQRKVGHRVSLITFLSFLGTGLNFAVVVTVTGNKKHALPIPIWTPFSQDNPGVLGMLLLVEAIGVILTVAGSGALSALLGNSIRAVQTQFRVVRDFFQREAEMVPDGLWDSATSRLALDRLVRGVQLHQSVLNLADELCRVLAPFLTVQLATIVFMICIALFQVSINPLEVRNIRFVVLFVNVATAAFSMCWMGSQLSNEALDVQLGVESGDWNLRGKEIGYVVKFILMRSQKAPAVVVGNNVHVGLPAFLEMIRSSYSLLAFLQKRARSQVD